MQGDNHSPFIAGTETAELTGIEVQDGQLNLPVFQSVALRFLLEIFRDVYQVFFYCLKQLWKGWHDLLNPF